MTADTSLMALPRVRSDPVVSTPRRHPASSGTDAPAPRGFSHVPGHVLAGLRELPCDLFVRLGSRGILYASRGNDAAEVVDRAKRGMDFYIRHEDEDLIRRALVAALPKMLSDANVPPIERSRTAYTISARVIAPLFISDTRIDSDRLIVSHEVIDTVTKGLTDEEDLVWSMVATMQKHLSTHTHAINTAVYSIILGRFLDLGGEDEMRDVGRGALLHDIGKNRVPEEVLDKPGPLDEAEWRIMRTHPRAGYEIVTRALGSVPGYAHIVAEHHERVDGSGYPNARLGYQVALDSQLVAIADAFDALTSARPYKRASTPYEALRTMRFGMHGQFNDEILSEFIHLLGGWRELRSNDIRDLEKMRG